MHITSHFTPQVVWCCKTLYFHDFGM